MKYELGVKDMAKLAREELFSPDETACVHVMNRAVRRCFLMRVPGALHSSGRFLQVPWKWCAPGTSLIREYLLARSIMTYTFESFCVMDELQLRSALDEYVRQSPAKAQNMLERLLESPRGEVKSESLAVMQKYFPKIVETHAIALLKDDDWLVRTTAIHILTRVRSRTARDEICHMLVSDEDECVRSWSVMYLGEHGDATSISALQDAVLNDRGLNHEGVPIAELAQKAIDRIRSR